VPGFAGCVVVALGVGEADGSAAETAAAPPTASSPATIAAVRTLRLQPLAGGTARGGSSGGGWVVICSQVIVNSFALRKG
jgi:hypothetical protein